MTYSIHHLHRVYSTPHAPGAINSLLTIARKIVPADLVKRRSCSRISTRASTARWSSQTTMVVTAIRSHSSRSTTWTGFGSMKNAAIAIMITLIIQAENVPSLLSIGRTWRRQEHAQGLVLPPPRLFFKMALRMLPILRMWLPPYLVERLA